MSSRSSDPLCLSQNSRQVKGSVDINVDADIQRTKKLGAQCLVLNTSRDSENFAYKFSPICIHLRNKPDLDSHR